MHTRQLFDIQEKVTIVTGGGRGIGRDLATALAEMGANVVVCGRKQEAAEQAAAELASHGVKTLGLRCDVRSADEVDAMVTHVVRAFGRIDVLVNNAGATWAAPAEDFPLEGWEKVMDVNVTGPFLCSRRAGREMIKQGNGRIVNIASVAAFRGASPEVMDAIPYQASKGAVVALTRDLACKWARHGVRVNAIAPGWFPTDMASVLLERHEEFMLSRIPLGRFGNSDDLKGIVVYLASAASDWVTGQTFVVDGGQTAW